MDSSIALATRSPASRFRGAPPRQNAVGAAIGLSFLDSALRLDRIRRLSETLTVTDHRVARRTTEVDVSLAMLDEGQRRATVLSRDLRSASRSEDANPGPDEVWVPVARIARRSAAPVTIGTPAAPACPGSAQHECRPALAAGLFRRCPREPGRPARRRRPTPNCVCCCHRVPGADGCAAHAIDVLVTERHPPPAEPPRPRAAGVVAGQGAPVPRHRAGRARQARGRARRVLRAARRRARQRPDHRRPRPRARRAPATYETPLHVASEEDAGHRLPGCCGRAPSATTWSTAPASPRGSRPTTGRRHRAGVDIARMYLSTDTDVRTAPP